MSSNLFKSYRVKSDQATRVIDTNDIIEQKLERIRFVLPNAQMQGGTSDFDGFSDGLDADMLNPEDLDALTREDYSGDEMTDGMTDTNVIKAERPAPPEPVYDGPSPEEMIEEAKKEIEQMRAQAEAELEAQKNESLEKAKNLGYQEGLNNAHKEAEQIKAGLMEEKRQMELQYEERLDELEPKFIQVLTDIYEKIFEVELSDSKDLILSLLRNSIRKIEGCKNFLVHVSRDDFAYVNEHKEELLSQSNQEGTTIDVIEDATLRQNDCMIETVNGIFDCGLGTQLSELKKRLLLLSYEAGDN